MFKDVNQDTLAILSMEGGTLNLYVYSILVNMSDKLEYPLLNKQYTHCWHYAGCTLSFIKVQQ